LGPAQEHWYSPSWPQCDDGSELRDDVAEFSTGQPQPPLTRADATGNYVALDLGGGRFAFYEHLAPGLSVKLGGRVRRGQVIARLGSTGQTSRPHLHFHVADANSPLGAEGQPYRLDGARTIGRYPSIAAFEAGGAWRPSGNGAGEPTLPSPNAVVMFENAGPLQSSVLASDCPDRTRPSP
jgi:murein DD-endopeptidase MepM/ murein hydrolase activator NlpD